MKGILLFAVLTLVAMSSVLAAAADTSKAACSSPEAVQFDFWVGDWQLNWGDSVGGTNHVTKPLGNCVIEEQFSSNDPNGLKGMSVSVYNPKLHQWEQTWVDNSGAYMVFTGGFADGKMTLSRTITRADGTEVIQRMVFSDIARDGFNWDWQGSTDKGVTWKTNWHIAYKRAKG
jgi:hypothetical protein